MKISGIGAVKREILIGGCVAALLAIPLACAGLGAQKASDPGARLPSVGLGQAGDPLDLIGTGDQRTYYQYTDDAGSVHFTHSLEDVPERWREGAGRLTLDVPPPSSPPGARAIRKLRAERDAAADEF